MCQLVIPYNYTSYLVFCKSIIKDFDTIRHYLLFFFSLSLFISFFFTKHNPQNGKRETNYKRELKSLKTRDLRRGDTPQIEAPWTRSWTKFSNPIRDLVRWSTNRWKGEGTLPTTKARMSEFTAAMSRGGDTVLFGAIRNHLRRTARASFNQHDRTRASNFMPISVSHNTSSNSWTPLQRGITVDF